MPIKKNNHTISSLQDWKEALPGNQTKNWKDGRSAKELARTWLQGDVELPEEISKTLENHKSFGVVKRWEAEPEVKLKFDCFRGEPRNTDLLVKVNDKSGDYLIAVEGKADEPFAETVSATFCMALERRLRNSRSKGIARIEQLVCSVMHKRSDRLPKVGGLRYQLFTACAGVAAKARSERHCRAVMLVHEFRTDQTKDVNHQRNADDLDKFVRRLSDDVNQHCPEGELLGPFELPGWPDVNLFLGKVSRNIRSVPDE